MLLFAAAGGIVAAASLCAALYVFSWRRRRKLGSSDSKSTQPDGGSPHDGLPLALHPVYKQDSANSREPFLGGSQRMLNLIPWRRSRTVQNVHRPSLVSDPNACMANMHDTPVNIIT